MRSITYIFRDVFDALYTRTFTRVQGSQNTDVAPLTWFVLQEALEAHGRSWVWSWGQPVNPAWSPDVHYPLCLPPRFVSEEPGRWYWPLSPYQPGCTKGLDQYNVKWWYFNQRLNWLTLFENLVELWNFHTRWKLNQQIFTWGIFKMQKYSYSGKTQPGLCWYNWISD